MKHLKGADQEYVELELLMLSETKQAMQLDDGDVEVWVPKSQLEEVEQLGDNMVRVVTPEWLAINKEELV